MKTELFETHFKLEETENAGFALPCGQKHFNTGLFNNDVNPIIMRFPYSSFSQTHIRNYQWYVWMEIIWCETSSGLPRKSSEIFGNLKACSDIFGHLRKFSEFSAQVFSDTYSKWTVIVGFSNSFDVIRVDGNHLMRSLAVYARGHIFHPFVIIEIKLKS